MFSILKLTHADVRLKIIAKTAVSQNLYMKSAELWYVPILELIYLYFLQGPKKLNLLSELNKYSSFDHYVKREITKIMSDAERWAALT